MSLRFCWLHLQPSEDKKPVSALKKKKKKKNEEESYSLWRESAWSYSRIKIIITSQILKSVWTLTTSQYTITHIVYFKTQRTVLENTKLYANNNNRKLLYWVVQAGLLTPLTFGRHHLSPLAAFTSGAYFLHNGRRWHWICEFYTANFKDIFRGLQSECVWQQAYNLLLVLQDAPKRIFSRSFSTLRPLSPVIFATATVVAFVLLRNCSFNFHCYTQREVMPTQKLGRKWHCNLSRLLPRKITKGIHSCKPASLNCPIVLFSGLHKLHKGALQPSPNFQHYMTENLYNI